MKSNTQKQSNPAWNVIKSIFGNIGRVVTTIILVCIITGCIVASILTVYILKYINSDEEVEISDINLNLTTIVYAQDSETGEPYEIRRIHDVENRVYVDYSSMPKHLSDALIAIEDKRFYFHQGVDLQRTIGSFVNLFIPIYTSQHGGSTITQQLVRDITDDKELRIERKVREIFRALNLEKKYSKEQILEAYLNRVYFGNHCYGIQAAANTYFDKDVSQLSVAECASIIGITNAPGYYDPYTNYEHNQERAQKIIEYMNKQGMFASENDYIKAKNEKIVFLRSEITAQSDNIQSWFEDNLMEEVITDLVNELDYTRKYATEQIYNAGYRIYTTVDVKLQDYLQEIYAKQDFREWAKIHNTEYPQSAFALITPDGQIKALAGARGEKNKNRMFNHATMQERQPGSTWKPISSYAMGFETDLITWSSVFQDKALQISPGVGQPIWTPINYYAGYYGNMTVAEAIRRSTNTIPVQLVDILTPKRVYNFVNTNYSFNFINENDAAYSPMSLGSLSTGTNVLEMAGAYQIFANGGLYTKPYSYTRIEDSDGKIVLEKDPIPKRVLTPETAEVMNKLLQTVITGQFGTGYNAKLGDMPVYGKTGTSDKDYNQWWIGGTPYYVSAVWLGFDPVKETIDYNGLHYPPPLIWKNIMAPIHENLAPKAFPESGKVVKQTFCTTSGNLAIEACPASAVGFYKISNVPGTCNEHLGIEVSEEDDSSKKPSIKIPASRDENEE